MKVRPVKRVPQLKADPAGPDGDTRAWAVAPQAVALSTGEVFPPEPPESLVLKAAVVGGALSVGASSYDAVLAEHVPVEPGRESCRSCGFVYADRRVCPALILAAAGYPVLADRVRVVPADREYGALCELTVAVQRMDARLDLIGSRVTAPEGHGNGKRLVRRWARRLAPGR